MSTTQNKGSQLYIGAITLVATLGGLLFGYDTAVVSGAVNSLELYFVNPLMNDATLATSVVFEYRVIVAIGVFVIGGIIGAQLMKLFGKTKGWIAFGLIFLAIGIMMYSFLSQALTMDAETAASIKGFVASSALVGCIIGGATAGYVGTKMGRRNGMILTAAFFTISSIGAGWPNLLNIWGTSEVSSFIIYRIIGGVGVGMASMLSPLYIAEIAPASIRGKLVSWNQFAIVSGILIIYFVNYHIASLGDAAWNVSTGWRYMFASGAIPSALFLLLLFFVPETPRFLVMNGKDEKALSILKKLNGEELAKSEFSAIKDTLVEKTAPWLSYGGFLIVIGIMLSVFQQIIGINAVLYYAPEIFKSLGSSSDSSLIQTIIVGAVNMIFTIIAIYTVDKFGRKPLMIIGGIGMGIAMVMLGSAFYAQSTGMLALFSMLLYIAGFAMSWGPVTWVLLSEIFPNSIRESMSIAVAAQWIANLAVSWTFPIMNDSIVLTEKFNHGFAYWIYGVFSIVSAIFVWKLVPETKGKTLEEIEGIWKKKK